MKQDCGADKQNGKVGVQNNDLEDTIIKGWLPNRQSNERHRHLCECRCVERVRHATRFESRGRSANEPDQNDGGVHQIGGVVLVADQSHCKVDPDQQEPSSNCHDHSESKCGVAGPARNKVNDQTTAHDQHRCDDEIPDTPIHFVR